MADRLLNQQNELCGTCAVHPNWPTGNFGERDSAELAPVYISRLSAVITSHLPSASHRLQTSSRMNALSLKSACLCFLWSFLFASVVSTEPTGSCVHPVFRDLVQLKRKVLAIGFVHGELALFLSGTADTDQLDGGLQINVLAANLNAFDVDLNPVPIPSGVPSGPVKFAC